MFPQPADAPDWKTPIPWSSDDADMWTYCQQDVTLTQALTKQKKRKPEPSVYEQLAAIEED